MLEQGTGIPGAALTGAHLRLPGLGTGAPALEIYQFASMPDETQSTPNRPGFRHIAFAVASVAEARQAVLAAGGGIVGEIVTTQTKDGRFVRWAYLSARRATSSSCSPGPTRRLLRG